MSQTEEEHEVARAAARLSALLKEYTKKLRDLSAQVRELQNRYAQAKSSNEPRALARAEVDFNAIRFGYFRLFRQLMIWSGKHPKWWNTGNWKSSLA